MHIDDAVTVNTPGDAPLAGDARGDYGFTRSLWFNALWFQSIWFCTVLGRDSLLPLTLSLLALHLLLARDTYRELLQLTSVAFVGIAVDAGLSAGGVFLFQDGVPVPLWLCCLWLAFATTLPRSLAWLGRRPMLTALAGAIVLPLNYWAGQRLGAVQFGYSLPVTLVTMGLIWAVALPALYRLTALLASADDGVRGT